MHDPVFPEADTAPKQLGRMESNNPAAVAPAAAQWAGQRMKVNLYQRGILRSCVIGTCSASPFGVSISAETALTPEHRCFSHFELTPKDIATMQPLRSREAVFDFQLELECIEWQERSEQLPVSRARSSIGRNRFWRHHLPKAESPGSGEP
jgi:hypothetical protein